jgi:hypothetical protein
MSIGKYDPNKVDRPTYVKKKYFNVQPGSNVYRILPPFGSLKDSGQIAFYRAVIFVQSTKGKRPVPTIMKKGRDGSIITRCPLFDKVEALSKSVEAMAADPNTDPTVLENRKKMVQSLSLDRGYYLNVINQAGEIGVLKIRYTAFQSLKKRLEELASMGVDPINPGPNNGVYFDFKRYKDEKGKTVYEVVPLQRSYKDPNTGRLISEMAMAPIDDTVVARMEKEAFDLKTMHRTFTEEEMSLIATLDPNTIDRVFAAPQESRESLTPDEFEADGEEEAASLAVPAQTTNVATAGRLSAPVAATAVAQPMSSQSVVDMFLSGNNK